MVGKLRIRDKREVRNWEKREKYSRWIIVSVSLSVCVWERGGERKESDRLILSILGEKVRDSEWKIRKRGNNRFEIEREKERH